MPHSASKGTTLVYRKKLVAQLQQLSLVTLLGIVKVSQTSREKVLIRREIRKRRIIVKTPLWSRKTSDRGFRR